MSNKTENQSLADPILQYDILEQVRFLKSEKQWENEGHGAVTLVKTPSLRIVLILLNEGVKMPEHSTEYTVSINVIYGLVEIATSAETFKLKDSTFINLAGGIVHSFHAIDESVLLLTVIPKI